MRVIHCEDCEKEAEADFSGATPVVPEGWQSLLCMRGWEFHCPECWAAFLVRIEKGRKEHAA